MQRPTGVTVIALLHFLGAGLLVLCGLMMFAGGGFLATMAGSSAARTMLAGMGVFLGILFLAFAALGLFIGIGLWKLKNWARVLTIVLNAISLVFAVLALFGALMHFSIGLFIGVLIRAAIALIIILYLLKPDVKKAFGAA